MQYIPFKGYIFNSTVNSIMTTAILEVLDVLNENAANLTQKEITKSVSILSLGANVHVTFLDYIEALAKKIPELIFSIPVEPAILTSAFIILVSTLTIIVGCFSSISKPKNALIPDPSNPNYHPTDNDNCKYYILNKHQLENEDAKQLTWIHIVIIPFICAFGLYSLYYSMNRWSIDTVNQVMTYYSLTISPWMIYTTFEYLLVATMRFFKFSLARFRLVLVEDETLPLGYIDPNLDVEKVLKNYPSYVHIWKPSNDVDPQINYIFDTRSLFLLPISAVVFSLFYNFNPVVASRPSNWIVSNIVAFCFSVSAISQLKFGRFKLAVALLSALFFYDIYFVFGTKIMVTVATKLDIPVKFVFPRNATFPHEFSLIGLGDLVLPGAFLDLCLRYDHYRYYEVNKVSFHHSNKVSKTYFTTGIISYIISLIITTTVMHITKTGQPALLYIVPLLFIGLGLQAWRLDDFRKVWDFNDDFEKLPKSIDEQDEDVEDEDYANQSDDSYDDWEDRVEVKRALLEQETDIDNDEDIIYQFLSSDEDDDTFIIGEDDDDQEDEDDDFVVDDEIDIVQILRLDLNIPVVEWYNEE